MTKKDATDCPACRAGIPRVPLITNTAQLSSAAKLAIGAAAGGVIEQEKQGQRELVASSQLPVDGLLGDKRPRWEALGVKILDDGVSDDPLFCHVELPAGWRKVPTEHPLWTNLVNQDGEIVATIRYKAAFYDRYADISLKVNPTASAEPECVCADCGHEQSMEPGFGAGGMGPCERCQSARVVLVTVVRDLFGVNWRDSFKDKESP